MFSSLSCYLTLSMNLNNSIFLSSFSSSGKLRMFDQVLSIVSQTITKLSLYFILMVLISGRFSFLKVFLK